MFVFEHGHHDQRIESIASAHALAHPTFLDKAFAVAQILGPHVECLHIGPEAVRAEIAD